MAELTARAVEILRRSPAGRWNVGSGYLVGRRWVLSAAHNVMDAATLLVRRVDETELPAEVVMVDEPGDIALLAVSGDSVPDDLPPVRFARVDRSRTGQVGPCWAIGFPRWKERPRGPSEVPRRESAQVSGSIPTGSNLRANLMELGVSRMPQSAGGRGVSEWQGMSGALVFADDGSGDEFAVGLVVEHICQRGRPSSPSPRWTAGPT